MYMELMSPFVRKKFAIRSRMILVVWYVRVGTQYLGQTFAESDSKDRFQKLGERHLYIDGLIYNYSKLFFVENGPFMPFGS